MSQRSAAAPWPQRFSLSLSFLVICFLVVGCSTTARPATWKIPDEVVQEAYTVPVSTKSGNYFLNSLFLKKQGDDNSPLIILSHGSPLHKRQRPKTTPESETGVALPWIDLGYSVLIVERRGYGRSREKMAESNIGDCDHRDYVKSGEAASEDLSGALKFAQDKLPINKSKVVLVGHSAGGFSSLFFGSQNPKGVVAVVSFAGGRGSKGNNEICDEEHLIEAFGVIGKTSRIPTLWVYNENDKIFSPELAEKMFKHFKDAGGVGEFKLLPPFGSDGHNFFSYTGRDQWLPIAKDFLSSINTK
jgi:pimeloyl-ACP methyl ester carboxylesterase